ncbi:MAG: peptidoglycan-binding protein [Candidatus Electrothrix sp. AR5]|nr:peptidoglycan-binding protein [Candidatus Electrothrix sp. AR5]
MKNGKALHKIIGCGVVMLAVFVFAGTGYSRSSCNTCQSCEQSQYKPPTVVEYAELQYRDGFPGARMYKRQQVEKLQCMLKALGYCSGSIDGWYGNSTARAVMLFLADNFQEIGYGKKLTVEQWDYLVNWAGARCSQYDKKKEIYRYQYRAPKYQQPQYTAPDYYQYKY